MNAIDAAWVGQHATKKLYSSACFRNRADALQARPHPAIHPMLTWISTSHEPPVRLLCAASRRKMATISAAHRATRTAQVCPRDSATHRMIAYGEPNGRPQDEPKPSRRRRMQRCKPSVLKERALVGPKGPREHAQARFHCALLSSRSTTKLARGETAPELHRNAYRNASLWQL